MLKKILVTISLAALAVVGSAATPAHASPNASSMVRNWQTGRCLDSNDDHKVYTLNCNGGLYQSWYFEEGHYGQATLVSFKNNQTGNCLDSNDVGEVYAIACNRGSMFQWWVRTGDANVTTYWNAQTGRCLDSNEAGAVYAIACNGGGYQAWKEGF